MDFNIILGGFMVAYGLFTLFARKLAPERFWKLEPMKKRWGERGGVVVHVIGYTVMPLVGGTVLLLQGLL